MRGKAKDLEKAKAKATTSMTLVETVTRINLPQSEEGRVDSYLYGVTIKKMLRRLVP